MHQNILHIDALSAAVSATANMNFQIINNKYTLKVSKHLLALEKNIKHKMVTQPPFYTSFAHKF